MTMTRLTLTRPDDWHLHLRDGEILAAVLSDTRARQLLDAASVRWRLHVVMGEGAPEIASLADELCSRGIAIGSRGLTATESVLLGSVAYKVVHLARTSVLFVR